MERLRFKITGITPLLMHNARLADPLDTTTRKIKEISSKRKKVDADHEEMARLEWYGGLYLKDGKPCIPAYVFEGALIGKGGAARKVKMGKQAAAALLVDNDALLEFDDDSAKLEALWKNEKYVLRAAVNVAGSKIFRTRPKFDNWSATIDVLYDSDKLNREHVEQWVEVAGRDVGLMDWRPRFGRFEVESVEEVD